MRKQNFEILRILATIGVIMVHLNGIVFEVFSTQGLSKLNMVISSVLYGFSIESTIVFILIMGYFNYQKCAVKLYKPILLLIQNVVLRLFVYFINVVEKKIPLSLEYAKTYMLTMTYFIIIYNCVYILSPFTNKLLNGLRKSGRKNFAYVIIGMFSIYPFVLDCAHFILKRDFTNWSPVGAHGSQDGTTTVLFFTVYVLGAIWALDLYKIKHPLLNFVISSSVVSGMYFLQVYDHTDIRIVTYYNPFVILSALSLFQIFEKVKCGFIENGGLLYSQRLP